MILRLAYEGDFAICISLNLLTLSMPLDYHSLLDIAFRSAVVYVFMIAAFRIFGKRELSQLSIADLALVVLISNAVQNAMVGQNTTLIGGLTAGTVLIEYGGRLFNVSF